MLTLEDRREFFREYANLVALFGDALVDRGLLGLKESDIVETLNVPLTGPGGKHYNGLCYHKPHRFLQRTTAGHTFYHAGWERRETVPVNQYLVPAKYQNLALPLIIRPALIAKAAWLTNFNLKIYGLDEFYVTLSEPHAGHTSLYVPIKAFLAKDCDAIVARNIDYLKGYTKGDEVGPAVVADPVSQAFLTCLRTID